MSDAQQENCKENETADTRPDEQSAEVTHFARLGLEPLCGSCAYRLTSLPKNGVCPECGVRYLSDELVLFGWDEGRKLNIASGTVMGVARQNVVVIACILLIATTRVRLGWMGQLLIAIGAVKLLFALWKRFSNMAPAPFQIRISPRGFGTRIGLGAVKLQRWGTAPTCAVSQKRKGIIWIGLNAPSLLIPDSARLKKDGIEFLIKSDCPANVWRSELEAVIDKRNTDTVEAYVNRMIPEQK